MAYNAIGKVYFFNADVKKGIAAFNKAIALNPDYAQAYFFRSQSYRAQGRYKLALEDILRAQALGHGVKKGYIENLQKIVK